MSDQAIAAATRRDRPLSAATALPLEAMSSAEATHGLSQCATQWLEQTWAAQALGFKVWTAALSAALDAAMDANDVQRMLEVRDTLLAVTLENAARCQSEALDAWCSLQKDLADLAIQGTLDFVRRQAAPGSGCAPWYPMQAA